MNITTCTWPKARCALGGALFLALCLAVAGGSQEPRLNPSFPTGDPEPGAREARLEYRLLVRGQFLSGGGMYLTWVDPTGPAAWLRSPGGSRGTLERGDVITQVNDRRVRVASDYYEALNASPEGRVTLRVRNVRSGREEMWYAQAIKVRIIGPPIVVRESHVKVLLIGLTNDSRLGPMIEVSLDKLRTTLRGVPGLRSQDVIELRGADVTAANMLRVVDRLEVKSSEALLCYYLGHGAYDPARAAGDPSGGHHLQIPSGDLMRGMLLERLKARGARLTVLVTDTCNVRSVAQPAPVYEHRRIFTGENRVLRDLLLKHEGIVDVSGSSRDQFGWFSVNPGGWFTEAFVNTCSPDHFRSEAFVSWTGFLGRLSAATSAEFQQRKRMVVNGPGTTSAEVLRQLGGQTDQRPQVFRLDVRVSR